MIVDTHCNKHKEHKDMMDQQPHELKKVDTVGTESSLESSGRGSTGNGSAASSDFDLEDGISIIANHEEEDVIPAAHHHQRRMNTVILLSIIPLAAALIALGVLLSNNTESTSMISSAKVQPSNTNTNITESKISSTAQSPSTTEIIIIETISNIENTQSKLPPNEVRDRVSVRLLCICVEMLFFLICLLVHISL